MASRIRQLIQVPSPSERLEFTGERFVPGTTGEIEHEHYHRYLFALELCRGRDVLDVASGEGYGSALLATRARSVVGVELVADVVSHARRSYVLPNIAFRVGECARLPVESGSVDVAVSFETIEHIGEQDAFVAELRRVLRPEGLLVLSSPVRGVYSPGNPNPFHVKELTRDELLLLVGRAFRHVACLAQTPIVGSAIVADGGNEAPALEGKLYWRRDDGSFEVEAGFGPAPYLLVVASDGALPALPAGFLHDHPYMARLLGTLRSTGEELSAQSAELVRQREEAAAARQQAASSEAKLEEARRVLSALERDGQEKARRIAAQALQIAEAKAEAEGARQVASALEERRRQHEEGVAAQALQIAEAKAAAEAARQVASALDERHRRHEERIAAQGRDLQRLTAEAASIRRELEARAAALARSVEVIATRHRGRSTVRESLGRAAAGVSGGARRVARALLPARLRERVRRRLVMRRIAATGLFDAAYYLSASPDVSAARVNPLFHYVVHGAREGRNPHRMFATSYYLKKNPDVAAAGINPLLHFALSGAAEGRRPHPGYDAGQYLAAAAKGRTAASTGAGAASKGAVAAPRPAEGGRRSDAAATAATPPQLPLGRPKSASEAPPAVTWRFRPRPLAPGAPREPGTQPPTARTLFFTHVLPYPPSAGNEYRIHRLLRWLQSIGHEVHLVVLPLPGEEPDAKRVARAAAEYPNLVLCQRDGTVLFQSRRSGVASMLEALGGAPPRSFAALDRDSGAVRSEKIVGAERTFCPDYFVDLLLRLEKSIQPDVAVASYVFMSRALPVLGDGVLKLIDTHDVFSTKSRKVVQFGVADGLAMSGAEEAALLRRADLVLAIQPDEEQELRAIAPDRPVVTTGVDFDVVGGSPASAADPVVLYVASSNALNVKGIRDFLSLAWPIVRRHAPAARLRVVGPICEAVDDGVDGVELLGRVDRLEAEYAGARVVINPAVAGTGLKIKTLEALSQLRPIVVWPSGVDGLEPAAGSFCDVAHDWYDFARKVVRRLTNDGAAEIAGHRDEIGRLLSPEVVYGPLRAAIETGRRPDGRRGN